MKKVTIVLVNWNGKKDTLECLSSLDKLNKADVSVETVIVDNASTDQSVDEITKKFPHVTVISLKENKGFTGGNNVGIEYARNHGTNYIWILNNDTLVEKDSMLSLVDEFKDDSVGIAVSKIYFMKGREFHKDRYKETERGKVIWYAGGIIDWNNVYGSHRGVDEVDVDQYETIEETDFATGCSFMVSTACLESVGLFDDRYFAYFEDMDFSMKIKKAGWKVIYVPSSIVWHKNAGSTDRPGNDFHQYYMTRNRLLFGMTYAPIRAKIALLRESLRFLLGGTPIQKKAILDFICFRYGKQFVWTN